MTIEKAAPLVDHYHKTYEVAYRLWEQRNRYFLYLVGTLFVASLFANGTTSLFVMALCVRDPAVCQTLVHQLPTVQEQFPIDFFNIAISVIVFYLMMSMFAQSNNISRYYAYIVCLENEIRQEMGLQTGVAFTREGDFARAHRSVLGKIVAYFFQLVLGGLLALYFGSRIVSELSGKGQMLWLWLHSAIAFFTLVLFLGYVVNSLGLRKLRSETTAG